MSPDVSPVPALVGGELVGLAAHGRSGHGVRVGMPAPPIDEHTLTRTD